MISQELTEAVKDANYASHQFGRIDDCIRCINCEVGIWNGEKVNCNA